MVLVLIHGLVGVLVVRAGGVVGDGASMASAGNVIAVVVAYAARVAVREPRPLPPPSPPLAPPGPALGACAAPARRSRQRRRRGYIGRGAERPRMR